MNLNLLHTGGIFHCYMLDKSIYHFRGVGSFLSLSLFLWKILCHIMWRQTPYYVASDLGLHCLPMTTGSQVRMDYQLEQ